MSTMRDPHEDGQQEPGPHRHSANSVCPNCGHDLSMFMELEITRPERIATRIANAFGTGATSEGTLRMYIVVVSV